MAPPIPQKTRAVKPRELLDIREREWRPQLAGVSLIAEVELPQSHIEQSHIEMAGRALGMLFTSAPDRGLIPGFARWPACVAAVTSEVAARCTSGTSWPPLWEVANVPAARQESDTWGKLFLRSLGALGKDVFPGQRLSYVGPILMHSGTPTYCLTDLFELLLERSALNSNLDAGSFCQWAVAGEHRLNSLDKPARRFISLGGDYSLETIECCMDLLARLQADPERAEYAVRVEWETDFGDAVWTSGLFANQHSACRLSDDFTREYVFSEFQVSGRTNNADRAGASGRDGMGYTWRVRGSDVC